MSRPRNGRVLNAVAECDAADVDEAVAAARRAFDDGRWRKLHYRDKKKTLLKLADLMERDAETLAVLESLDVGKPISNALGGDVPNAIRSLRYYAEAIDKVYGEVGPETQTGFRSPSTSRSASSAPSCRGTFRCIWRCGKLRRLSRWAIRLFSSRPSSHP